MMCRHPLHPYVYSRERCSFKAKYSNIIDNSICAFILVHPSHKCDLCCYDGWVRRIHYISLVPRVRNRIHLYIQWGRNSKHGIMCAELLTVIGAFANTGLSTCRIMPSIPSCVCFINRGNLSYLVLTLFVVSCYSETNICVYIWMLWLPQSKPEIWIYILMYLPRKQSSWGQYGAHPGLVGPRLAPYWPHEPCYQGYFWHLSSWKSVSFPSYIVKHRGYWWPSRGTSRVNFGHWKYSILKEKWLNKMNVEKQISEI